LVTKAEHAYDSADAEREAYNTITTELNKLAPEERAKVADAMRFINCQDRQKDDSLPYLALDENHTGPGEYELVGIHMDRPRAIWDLEWLISDVFEHKDVYNVRADKW